MKKVMNKLLMTAVIVSLTSMQQLDAQPGAEEVKAKADAELDKKGAEWVTDLHLGDKDKEQRVSIAISAHLKAVRDWNNEHPSNTVPAGINPATGNKLSELDRQVIACSAIPASVHDNLMNALKKELSPAQVETILDRYTIGKVAFTLNGYKSIVPDLTKEEEAKIVEYLKQAREQAIDYKSMRLISAIFEIYKTKCEQYLNSNGRNWRQLYKAYVDKVKEQKQKENKTN
jgi:hypothetical protein